MKARKRTQKLFERMIDRLDQGLPLDQFFNEWLASGLPDIVHIHPEAVLYMPNASRSVQINSLRADGKLLLCKEDWKFDSETVFPGSTAFKEFILTHMGLCNVDNDNVPLRQEMFSKRKPSKADCLWEPISKLSMLPAADITEMDRAILRGLAYPEAVLHIQHLLDKHASPQREPVNVVTPELQASFNHCMAVASDNVCANDDVMVIKA
jgi:hypothetical protein